MSNSSRPLVPVAAFAALAAITALLTGCTPPAGPGATPGPSASGDSSGALQCERLLPAETLYAYNPNFSPIVEFEPDDGSPAASAVADGGIACRWQNPGSGVTIDVSVARLDDDQLTALKDAAVEAGTMVPTYGHEASFTTGDDGVGAAQVFDGSFWVVAQSVAFFEPADATDIVSSVLAALE